MKRFDRIIATLLTLQTRRVVTAAELAEEFGVSQRTVYRDIRSLETAGVPIAAEAGIGYYLVRGYHLPPVAFTAEEASALLLGAKFMQTHAQGPTSDAYRHALAKVRAVLEGHDQDLVENPEDSVAVFANGPRHHAPSPDPWLAECQRALARRRVIEVEYRRSAGVEVTQRRLEAIGLYHSRSNWHLMAWCRLREDYRDFRLDRIQSLVLLDETYTRHDRLSLEECIAHRGEADDLVTVDLGFPDEVAQWVSEARYGWGFTAERRCGDEVRMTFLVPSLDSLAQWLSMFAGRVTVHSPDALRQRLEQRGLALTSAYGAAASAPSARSVG